MSIVNSFDPIADALIEFKQKLGAIAKEVKAPLKDRTMPEGAKWGRYELFQLLGSSTLVERERRLAVKKRRL